MSEYSVLSSVQQVFTQEHLKQADFAKHLTDPFTNRDLFGVVRGHCLQCSCTAYLKETADYTVIHLLARSFLHMLLFGSYSAPPLWGSSTPVQHESSNHPSLVSEQSVHLGGKWRARGCKLERVRSL
eukprot:1500342-Pyramimonas_sp.AAC.1